MNWFGKNWGAPFWRECPQIAVPVGQPCHWCQDLIAEGDDGVQYDNGPYMHYECHMRQVIGSRAHVLGDCSCYVPGSSESDPPEMTKRQAAKAALEMWELLRDLQKTLT